jgi:thiol-disulfide isomerase/thioredoxin
MKNLFLFCLATAIHFIASAQNGIIFQTGKSWDGLKAEAKAANKLIFLDAYASWCAPCKKMSEEVFTQKEVGSLFNSQFINVKIDMEGNPGKWLASKYGVTAYPSLLFIDGNGKMVHKVIGFLKTGELISAAKNSRDPDKQYSTLLQLYQNGKLSNAGYFNLLKASDDAGENEQSSLVAAAYLAVNKNWMEEPQLLLLLKYTKDILSNQFEFLIKNEVNISKMSKYGNISDHFDQVVTDYVMEKTVNEDEKKFDREKAKELFNYSRGTRANLLFHIMAFDYAMAIDEAAEIEQYGLELGVYAGQLSSGKLDLMSYLFLRDVTNKTSLKKALEWALLSVKAESKYLNNENVAGLYFKLGEKGRAKKYAEIALKLGVAEGEDVESTRELLKKL